MGITVGLLIPLLGTMLGAAFVFFMKKDMSPRLQKSLLGFASGVMVAASVWSLLIPAIEMRAENGNWAVLPAAIGFIAGIGFLLLLDELTPHLHIGTDNKSKERWEENIPYVASLLTSESMKIKAKALWLLGDVPFGLYRLL